MSKDYIKPCDVGIPIVQLDYEDSCIDLFKDANKIVTTNGYDPSLLHGWGIKLSHLSAQTLIKQKQMSDSFKSVYDLMQEKKDYFNGIRDGSIIPPVPKICGIPEIDGFFSNGFNDGSLTVFISTTGGFKSWTLINLMLGFSDGVKNVYYINLEMHQDEILDRVAACLSYVSHKKIQHPKSCNRRETYLYQKAMANLEKLFKKTFIYTMPQYTTALEIEKILETRDEKDNPDVIIIDQLSIMSPNESNKYRPDLDLGNIAKELRRLGINWSCPIITASQISRTFTDTIKKTASENKRIFEQANDFGSEDTNEQGKKSKKKPIPIHSVLNETALKDSHQLACDSDNIIALYNGDDFGRDPMDKKTFKPLKLRYGDGLYCADGNEFITIKVKDRCGRFESDPRFLDEDHPDYINVYMSDKEAYDFDNKEPWSDAEELKYVEGTKEDILNSNEEYGDQEHPIATEKSISDDMAEPEKSILNEEFDF